MGTDEGSEGGGPPELTADECVRAGMYWFGRNDLAAAEAWWRRALYLEPNHVRAQECLRLLAKSTTRPEDLRRLTPGAAPPVLAPTPSPAESPLAGGAEQLVLDDESDPRLSSRLAAQQQRSSPQLSPPPRSASQSRISSPPTSRSASQIGQPPRSSSQPQIGQPARSSSQPQIGQPARSSSQPQIGQPQRSASQPQLGQPARSTSQSGQPPRSTSQPQIQQPSRAPQQTPRGAMQQPFDQPRGMPQQPSQPYPSLQEPRWMPQEPQDSQQPRGLSQQPQQSSQQRGMSQQPQDSQQSRGQQSSHPYQSFPQRGTQQPLQPPRSMPQPPPSSQQPARGLSQPPQPARTTSQPPRATPQAPQPRGSQSQPFGPEPSAPRISGQRLSSQDIERRLFGDEERLDPPVDVDAAAWALGQAVSTSASTDPLEFATDIPEDTGDIIRVDSGTPVPEIERTPWDEGPARTSVVTLNSASDHDPIAEPTPLPELDRASFFGRGGEFDPELVGTLEDSGSLPLSALADPTKVLDEKSDPIMVPATDIFGGEPDIRIDDPIEASNSPAYGTAAIAAAPEELLHEAKDFFQLHDFDGAIDRLEKLLAMVPNHAEARPLLVQARSQLMRMLESKIGDLDRFPKLLISSEEVIWLNLNHRAGFILSQIDGSVSYDDIVALSGMPRLDTLRILVELIQNRVIGAD